MTVTGTITRDVSNLIVSPSIVSPSGPMRDSVIPSVAPLSADFDASVLSGFGASGFLRPDCAKRLEGSRETLKSSRRHSLVFVIRVLALEVLHWESVL